MIASWAVVLSALVYLCLLFAVAHWGDLHGRRIMQGRARSTIYALALAVYCTSWTFFGSVGLASRSGLDFLTIYVGPILMIGFGYALVGRVVQLAKAQNITSVADFVAARYGKSERVAALVSAIAVVGSVPYIALQLKAVSASLGVFLTGTDAPFGHAMPVFGDLALVVAFVLAGFAVAFGTRHTDATEHQDGLMVAISLESVVKLVAFLLVGIYVTFFMFGGLSGIDRALAVRHLDLSVGLRSADPATLVTLTVLAASASLLLPRQFHMTVVENRAVEDVRRAAWLFPLYLVLINLFVIPIALGGLALFPEGQIDRDMTVLAPPLRDGARGVALAAFLGGLSAATAMVIVESIALSTMLCNDLIMPVLLRVRWLRLNERPDLSGLLLAIRRGSILGTLLLGYLYFKLVGEAYALVTMGLVSFCAAAQFAPPILFGIYWKGASLRGALVGLSVGFLVWLYTLLLPALAPSAVPRAQTRPPRKAGAIWAIAAKDNRPIDAKAASPATR